MGSFKYYLILINTMEYNKFFKTYYMILIFYAVLGILDSLVFGGVKDTVGEVSNLWIGIVSVVGIAVFIMSIFALVKFIKLKLPKLTWILPIYHLFGWVFFVVYGLIWGVMAAIQGNPINEQSIPPGLMVVGVLSSIFELGFSIFILKKFK